MKITHKYNKYKNEPRKGITTYEMHSYSDDVESKTQIQVPEGTRFDLEKFQVTAAENNRRKIEANVALYNKIRNQ